MTQLLEYYRTGDMRFIATVEQSQPRLGVCRRPLKFWRQQLKWWRLIWRRA